MTIRYLRAEDLAYIHECVMTSTGGTPGMRDVDACAAVATRVRLSNAGMEGFIDAHDKVAKLFLAILSRKPFLDGNKRVGIAAAATFLRLNGEELVATDHEIVDFCRAVERGSLDRTVIRNWFRTHTTKAA